jgi:PPOX class probable F420-dependent enzyme
MLDFTSRFGRRVDRRLRQEQIIWLTTVDTHQTPQPRPVWFHWDGRTVLIFSESHAAKVRHIARNCNVALSLNTDEEGGDVVVVVGEAVVSRRRPPAARVKAYLRKYRQGLKDIEMTIPQFTASFNVPILVTPRSMRGL